jgi:GT2 family glycosyltransferase
MKLSILIVNWNSRDYLRACLDSIRGTCGHLSPQVVVVDGGSFDGCAEMIAADYPEVEFVQSQDNIGFGRSNNLGFERVKGDALLLLNPDTELQPGAVDVLLAELQRLPQAGLIGARLLNSDGSLQLSAVHPLPTPWNAALDSDWLRRRWWSREGRSEASESFEVEAISGACMMIRTEIFRQLAGFDPRYFMYAEDMDLCFRTRKIGLKIHYAPRSEIIHHGGGSSKTCFSRFSVVMIREALGVYMHANLGGLRMAFYRILMGISAVLRLLVLISGGAVAGATRRGALQTAILKWWAVFRWSMGMEGWARKLYRSAACSRVLPEIIRPEEPVGPGSPKSREV